MAIRTISEYNNNDTNFYHVERAGYITVSDMIFDAFTDMINNGFNAVAVAVRNDFVSPAKIVQGTWPPTIQKFTIANGGNGYEVGANITVRTGTAITPLIARITGVDTKSTPYPNKVTSFSVADAPLYSAAPNNPTTTAFYDTLLGGIDTTYFSGNFETKQSVTSSAGVTPVGYRSSVRTNTSGLTAANNTSATWTANFGVNGSGLTAGGSPTIANTWPTNTNTIWSWQSDITKVYVGQEVFCDDPASSIPPNTYITAITSDVIVNDVVYVGPTYNQFGGISRPASWYETTKAFSYFTLSNVVTIPKDTIVKTRGRSLTLFSNVEQATSFTVTLEAGGGVDPCNDVIGVYGNVATTTTNNNIVVINNISNGQLFKPVIYPGQEVTSQLVVGSLGVNDIVTVVSANMSTNYTSAVVKLSANVSFSIPNEPVRFKFSQLQPWRISANVPNAQTVNIYAATPIQLEDNGNIAFVYNSSGTTIIDRAGAMGAAPTSGGMPNAANTYEGFINRSNRLKSAPQAFPLSYALTITNRGVFLGTWEGSWSTLQKESLASNDSFFNWFLIQRPVNKITGKTLTTGCAPVFCVNSVGYKYYKFIVRESDVLHPYQGIDSTTYRQYIDESGATPTLAQDTQGMAYRTPANAHWKDSYALLNTTNQISLTEDSKYLVSFLHNLTTPRFRYSEELDMLGQTSADVCMASNDVSITAYQESGPRLYKALPANNIYNSGLRICVLKKMP